MQYYNKYWGMACRKALKGLQKAVAAEDCDETAKYRQKIVLFYQKNGLKLTQEAFEVKRSTLYNWQKTYKEYGNVGLINGDRTPKRKRQSAISEEIKDFVLKYRYAYGNIHKEEIKPHLDEFCKKERLTTISISSIGRIIRELKEEGKLTDAVRYRFNGKSGNLTEAKTKHKEKERRKDYHPQKPGDLIQADSMHLLVYGKKRYLINAIDINGRMAFSREYERLNSENAKDFFKQAQRYFPFRIRRIQTDNGSEFDGYAQEYFKKEQLTHFWNYPRSPKSNAFIERFNRTIKEQFVYRNEGCIENCNEANEKIKDWLLWYNTKRFHKGLNYQTPLHYSLASLKSHKSNML